MRKIQSELNLTASAGVGPNKFIAKVASDLKKPNAIFVMGATATGKTDLAIEIAQRFPVELISVDSALIYRGMDIGSAKPSAEVLWSSPHFLVDIIDPAQHYSAWDFVSDTKQLIEQIQTK